MTEDDAANVFGRLTALEIMTTYILTAVLNKGRPLDALAQFKHELFSTTQNYNRPVNDFADKCWEQAVEALELQFENLRKRLGGAWLEP